jgi:hypothetical protein
MFFVEYSQLVSLNKLKGAKMVDVTLNSAVIITISAIVGGAIASAMVYFASNMANKLLTTRVLSSTSVGNDIVFASITCSLLNQKYPNDEASFDAEKAKSGNCYVRNCCQWAPGGTGGLLVDQECLTKCG